MFICLQHMIVPYLSKLFNDIFHTGVYPDLWIKSVIVPIHKKSSTNLTDNHRGISPGSVFSKIFTIILNKRLTSFFNSNNIVTEEQAGFIRDYSTVDNGFVLESVVHKYLNRNKKVSLRFIYKLTQSIRHCKPFSALKHSGKNGINGIFLHVQTG